MGWNTRQGLICVMGMDFCDCQCVHSIHVIVFPTVRPLGQYIDHWSPSSVSAWNCISRPSVECMVFCLNWCVRYHNYVLRIASCKLCLFTSHTSSSCSLSRRGVPATSWTVQNTNSLSVLLCVETFRGDRYSSCTESTRTFIGAFWELTVFTLCFCIHIPHQKKRKKNQVLKFI